MSHKQRTLIESGHKKSKGTKKQRQGPLLAMGGGGRGIQTDKTTKEQVLPVENQFAGQKSRQPRLYMTLPVNHNRFCWCSNVPLLVDRVNFLLCFGKILEHIVYL